MTETMRTSLMLPVEHAPGEDIAERFANMLEVARLAEQGGIDMLTAPQHYLAAPSQYLHCVPVLARVAAEVSRVALVTNIIQLTLHHPVEVAETGNAGYHLRWAVDRRFRAWLPRERVQQFRRCAGQAVIALPRGAGPGRASVDRGRGQS